MGVILNRGEPVHCPLCGKPQEDKVEDFVIPGRVGIASEAEEECYECGGLFTVICIAADQYEVLAV